MRYRWGFRLSRFALFIFFLGAVSPALARANMAVFSSTGAQQTFVVPAGVTMLHVVAIGGRGGNTANASGGLGAEATSDLSVTPGETLYVEVGGNGADGTADSCAAGAGGFNGGGASGAETGTCHTGAGGGGGASDVRTIPLAQANSLDSRLVVAGAGGGAASSEAGGAAGEAGSDGTGVGGGGGQPGTSSAGGAGGSSGQVHAGDGGPGTGGAGGDDSNSADAGGGGGAGLYGGGGGLQGFAGFAFPSGGGGGSSGFGPGTTNTSVTADTTGVPSITITYTPPPTFHTLSVVKTGSGSGSVTSTDGHIRCGSTCSHSYLAQSTVTLKAVADHGSSFRGWSGGGCSGTGTCKVVMGAARKVTAIFRANPPNTAIVRTTINSGRGRAAGQASFKFTASGRVTGFQCRLISERVSHPHFTSCRSPKAYSKLKSGNYTFEVRAVGPGGIDATPARASFRIR